MAAVDEIVFHQVLGWHHFYDRSTPDIALLSDGLLHAAELVALVAGAFLLADLLRRRALVPVAAWAGGLLGAGVFQLVDGVVNHKVLRLHQVRYDVDLLPYDLAWNGFGVALVLAAGVLLLRSRRDAGAGSGRAARGGGAHAGGEPADAPGTGPGTAPATGPGTGPVDAVGDHRARGAHGGTGRRRATGPATGAMPTVRPASPGAHADGPRRRRDDRPSGRRAADP
ncbi:DUF2243 domain-containing protein [Cellulomonas shaoxiangyii]|uniref:DUF2243 domain-containing protein n=3 Tax=Cellulomonas shaoxiangyii TaxID=2566013 RepID=A0A4P7SM99_9CELL|nr:DUF2243 domain-containing protein [Cellulomonas shaoxiangyii]